jgi:HSP20 family molecular chaperone IbpA
MVATKGKSENNTGITRSEADKPEAPAVSQEAGVKAEVRTPEGVERTRTGRVYTPAVDIYETDQAVVLTVDMPGVDDKSVDVRLDKNVLTIYGHVEPWKPEGYTLAYAEYGVGDYERSFTISNEIDWEHIEGMVKNGVLKLTLPKVGPATLKKIEIKGE